MDSDAYDKKEKDCKGDPEKAREANAAKTRSKATAKPTVNFDEDSESIDLGCDIRTSDLDVNLFTHFVCRPHPDVATSFLI